MHITVVLLNVKVADVIISSVTCGPNATVAPVAAFSFENLPLILGGLAVLALLYLVIRNAVRRVRPLA